MGLARLEEEEENHGEDDDKLLFAATTRFVCRHDLLLGQCHLQAVSYHCSTNWTSGGSGLYVQRSNRLSHKFTCKFLTSSPSLYQRPPGEISFSITMLNMMNFMRSLFVRQILSKLISIPPSTSTILLHFSITSTELNG